MASLFVHVIPLGWEHDRATKPFTDGHHGMPQFYAHRVHVVVPGKKYDGGYPAKVRKTLKDIVHEVNVLHIDRYNAEGNSIEFQSILGKVSEICARETAAGNEVYINLGAGSKLAAFAAGLAGMAYEYTGKIHFYYPHPEGYTAPGTAEQTAKGLGKGLRGIETMDAIQLQLPVRPAMAILGFLRTRKNGQATFGEILYFLQQNHIAEFNDFSTYADQTNQNMVFPKGKASDRNKALNRLRRVIVQLNAGSLELVETGQAKRIGWVRLTQQGETYSLLSHPL